MRRRICKVHVSPNGETVYVNGVVEGLAGRCFDHVDHVGTWAPHLITKHVPGAFGLHDRRVLWDEHYAALSGARSDIGKSMRYSIGKSYAEEYAEKAALAEVEAKIEALGSRP